MDGDDRNIERTTREQRYRLINWNAVCAPLIEEHFRAAANRASNRYFGTPFVTRDEEVRQIQLSAGSHAIGVLRVRWNSSGRPVPRQVSGEHGASLVVSQQPITGGVAVILYPFESETIRRSEKFIIWSVFPDPLCLTPRRLSRAVKDFFTYGRVSSAVMTPSRLDQWRIDYLIFRNRRYTDGKEILDQVASHWSIVLTSLAIGILALIYAAIDHEHVLEVLKILRR